MNNFKKFIAAALVVCAAICCSGSFNTAFAEEINKLDLAAKDTGIVGNTTGIMVAGNAAETILYEGHCYC